MKLLFVVLQSCHVFVVHLSIWLLILFTFTSAHMSNNSLTTINMFQPSVCVCVCELRLYIKKRLIAVRFPDHSSSVSCLIFITFMV